MSLRTVHVSRLLVPLIAALLVSAAVPSVDASCNLTAPGNCSFRKSFCQWSASHWSRSSSYNYAYLAYMKTSGSLTSRYLCVGSAVSHCLRFQYYLKNNKSSLKVHISHERNNSKIQIWKTSGKAQWKTAEIAVKTNSSFRLVIEGTRKSGERNRNVRIRDLVYDKNNCSDEAVSITTIVSSSSTHGLTTSTSTPTTVASSRNTTLTAVSSFFSGNITTTVTPGRFSTSVSTSKTRSSRKSDTTTVNNQATDSSSSSPFSTHSVTNNSSADGLRGDADSSTDVGVIVGVLLAAILIGCLIVTLIVFLRWKQLMCWKLNSDDKQTAVQVCFKGEACGASSNVGATRNDNYTQLDIADASRPHCYSSLTEVRASQISMENYSAVRDVSGDPSTLTESTATLYELAQPVLPSAPNGLVNSGFQSSLDSPYENNGGQSIFQHREDDGHSNHNVVCFNNRDGKEHTEPVYSKQAPYEHTHSACKSDTGGKGRLGKLDNDPQTPSHPSLEDEALHGLGGEASGVYHVLEETEKQNLRVKPTSTYQIARIPMAEDSARQELDNPASSVYHILENHGTSHSGPDDKSAAVPHSTEDITSSQPDADDAYHILEAESTPQLPSQTADEIYQNLTEALGEENAACDSRDIIHTPSSPTKPESSPLSCEEAYNRLHFDKTGAVFAEREEGRGVGDEIYSHLKEGGEDMYDEVRREGRRNVIDEDYSHI